MSVDEKTKFTSFIDQFLSHDIRCNKELKVLENLKLMFPIQQQILTTLNENIQYVRIQSMTIKLNNIIQIFKIQGILFYQNPCTIDLYVEDGRLLLSVIHQIIVQPHIQQNYTLNVEEIVKESILKQTYHINTIISNVEQLFNSPKFNIDALNIYYNNFKIQLLNVNTNFNIIPSSVTGHTSSRAMQFISSKSASNVFDMPTTEQNVVMNYIISLLQSGIEVIHNNKQKYLYMASTTAYLVLSNHQFNHEEEVYINVKLTKKIFPLEHIFDIVYQEHQPHNIGIVLSKYNIYTQRMFQIKQQIQQLESIGEYDSSQIDYNQDVKIPVSHYIIQLQLHNNKNKDIAYLLLDCFRILQDRPSKYPEILQKQYNKISKN